MIQSLQTKLYYARRLTWGSYCLFLVSMISAGFLREPQTPGSLLVIGAIPLLLLLPGMARENYKSLSMLCFVTLFYFIVIVLNLWSPNKTPLDWVSVTLISVLFCAAMMFSRWKQYEVTGNGAAPASDLASNETNKHNAGSEQ